MARELVPAPVVAERFNCNKETIRRLYRAGTIPGYKVGRYLRFDVDEVREALRTTGGNASAPVIVEPDFDALDVA